MAEADQRSAEWATRQTIAFLEGVLRASLDGVLITDSTQQIIRVNAAFCDFLGQRPDALVETNLAVWLEQACADGTSRWAELQEGVRAAGACREVDFKLTTREGQRWLSVNAALVDPVGEEDPGLVITIWRDVTEQRRVEEALKASEARFRRLAENAQDVLYRMSLPDGRYEYVSPASLGVFGFTPAQFVNEPLMVRQAIHPDWRDYFVRHWTLLLAGEMAPDYEYQIIHGQSGETRWIHQRNVLVRDDGGRPIAIEAIVSDITNRKQTEERLRDSEERFRLFFERAGDAIFVFDLDGTFVAVNEKACSSLGYSSDELLTCSAFDIEVAGESQSLPDRWRVVSLGQVIVIQADQRCKDGSTLPVEVSLGQCQWRGETLMMAMARDVTERHHAEARRLDLERQMQQAQKLESLGVLAGGIAHDFNNILMAVLANAEMALSDLPPRTAARRSLGEIVTASERAVVLVKQMLAYAGKGQFVVEAINLSTHVADMARLLGVSISKKAVLERHLAGGLPTIVGDAAQVRQVTMNLIINASEALGDHSGTITLATGTMTCDRDYLATTLEGAGSTSEGVAREGAYVFLEVADTGCGMDGATVGRMFDPFFSTKFTGRGLGLAATLGIVHAQEGVIKVDSEVGRGTTVRVLFPVAQESEGEVAAADKDDELRASGWQGDGCILVVDDEETVRAVTQDMLEMMGFDVLVAEDGNEAVEIYRQHADQIVCVLLDLTMPKMGGEEALCEIRRIRTGAKVIVCTGYGIDGMSHLAGSGLAGLLQKPYRYSVLEERLKEALLPSTPPGCRSEESAQS